MSQIYLPLLLSYLACAFAQNATNSKVSFRQFSINCPSNMAPQISGVTGQPQTCNPFVFNSCTAPYQCTPTNSGAICCSSNPSTSGVMCPSGVAPYAQGGITLFCSFSSGIQTCPLNYQCTTVSTSVGAQSICCPATFNQNPNMCPNGQIATSTCSPSFQSCQLGYSCQQVGSSYFCCPGTQSTANSFCVNSNGAQPGVPCSFDSQCAMGTSCQLTTTGTRNCCPINSLTVCAVGSPLMVNGAPQSCNGVLNTCPSPYNCLYNPTMSQSYCCISGNTNIPTGLLCPNPGSQPNYIMGVPQSCSGNSVCPAGYQCFPSLTNVGNSQGICCTAGNVASCNAGYLSVNGVCKRLSCVILDN